MNMTKAANVVLGAVVALVLVVAVARGVAYLVEGPPEGWGKWWSDVTTDAPEPHLEDDVAPPGDPNLPDVPADDGYCGYRC